tara:strand:+ start:168 stop:533 length:366 start_codon:yes stop_codon:yes gene_type:complete
MNNQSESKFDIKQINSGNKADAQSEQKDKVPKKGPISFLSGSLTALIFCLLCYRLSQALIIYFSIHTPNYNSPIAQSIASGFKTLIIGTSFLATFTFGFIGLGLSLVFIRSLFDADNEKIE